MIRRVFLDANVVLDWLNADSEKNKECTQCIEIITTLYNQPLVSPTTFAIVYYFIGKHIKDKAKVRSTLVKAFKHFEFTTEDQNVMEKVFFSPFQDLEDGIQYYSAWLSRCDAIITYNLHDFRFSEISVLHPQEFIQLHTIN